MCPDLGGSPKIDGELLSLRDSAEQLAQAERALRNAKRVSLPPEAAVAVRNIHSLKDSMAHLSSAAEFLKWKSEVDKADTQNS